MEDDKDRAVCVSTPGFQDGGRVKEIFTAVKQIGITDEEAAESLRDFYEKVDKIR